MSEENKCKSCGMPLRSEQDYRKNNSYCKYCTNADGELLSFDEVLSHMKSFIQQSTGVSESSAISTAMQVLLSQPAWRQHKGV